jgi:hypothetical protein
LQQSPLFEQYPEFRHVAIHRPSLQYPLSQLLLSELPSLKHEQPVVLQEQTPSLLHVNPEQQSVLSKQGAPCCTHAAHAPYDAPVAIEQ